MIDFARAALRHYGLADATLTLLTDANNTVYRVDAGAARYMLRLHRPGRKPLAWIEAELVWLTALNNETALHVPQPAGRLYATSAGIAMLFTWREGEPLTPAAFTPQHAHALGGFAAALHTHGATIKLPDGMARPRLDWEGLFGAQSPYQPDADGDALITLSQRALMTAAAAKIKATFDALDALPDAFGLIHADLIPKNLLWTPDGQIAALDFDDCAVGYGLYDLAPVLWFMQSEPQYVAVREALWAAYT
ncbi:MAG: phosphotransferase, partial [Armatimonadetes bacterium]|nr:phosphotransferase [Anaerolineae bacterium]